MAARGATRPARTRRVRLPCVRACVTCRSPIRSPPAAILGKRCQALFDPKVSGTFSWGGWQGAEPTQVEAERAGMDPPRLRLAKPSGGGERAGRKQRRRDTPGRAKRCGGPPPDTGPAQRAT